MDILPLLAASQASANGALARSLLHDLSAVAISLSLLSSTPRPAKELKRIAKAWTEHGGAEEAALASECQAILARWRSFATATSGGSTSSAGSTSSSASSSASASSASSAATSADKPHKSSSMMAAVGFEAQNLALSAPMERDVDQFATDFLHCMSAWHTGQLRAQDPPPGQPADAPDELRFTDAASLTTLIGSATRAAHLGKDLSRKHARSCGCGPCVKGRRVRAAFDGNMNAQFQPYIGWRLSGFGVPSHLGGLALAAKLLPSLHRAAQAITPGRPLAIVGRPILICKPPSGDTLKPHIDGGSFLDMYVFRKREEDGGGG